MSSILQLKTSIGGTLIEARGQSVRIKVRGQGEVFIPYDDAAQVARTIATMCANAQRARA